MELSRLRQLAGIGLQEDTHLKDGKKSKWSSDPKDIFKNAPEKVADKVKKAIKGDAAPVKEAKLGVPDQANLTHGKPGKDPMKAGHKAAAKVTGSDEPDNKAIGKAGNKSMSEGADYTVYTSNKAKSMEAATDFAHLDGAHVDADKNTIKVSNDPKFASTHARLKKAGWNAKPMSEAMDMEAAGDAIKDTHKRMKALHGHAKRHHKKGDHKMRDKSLKSLEKMHAMAKDQAPDAMVSEEVVWDSSILEEADMPETVKKAMGKVRELHAHAKAMHKAGNMKAHGKAMAGLEKVCDHCDSCMK
jgi:hypothetical protein